MGHIESRDEEVTENQSLCDANNVQFKRIFNNVQIVNKSSKCLVFLMGFVVIWDRSKGFFSNEKKKIRRVIWDEHTFCVPSGGHFLKQDTRALLFLTEMGTTADILRHLDNVESEDALVEQIHEDIHSLTYFEDIVVTEIRTYNMMKAPMKGETLVLVFGDRQK
jgi:hypothetical protein